MSNIIRTQYKTNGAGRSQIVAKGGGKQRTMNYDPSQSSDTNHGTAAGILGIILGWGWHDGITHDQSDDGTRHGFSF